MSQLLLKYLDPAGLLPSPHNARRHPRKQLKQLEQSFKKFGFVGCIIVNRQHVILAGHGRVEAAIACGMATVPCIIVDHLTVAQERAYMIADNQLALNATYDETQLALEFLEILQLDPDFDLTVTGFDIQGIDKLIETKDAKEGSIAPEDDVLPPDENFPTVTELGDLWRLGNHQILCGDSRDQRSFLRLMGQDRAQMVIADSPYNVKIQGHVGGSGKIKQREFLMASGEMSGNQFTSFLSSIIKNLVAFSIDGSIHLQFMDWRHMTEMMAAGMDHYEELKNLIVWDKGVGGMGTFYRSQHEFVFAFKNGTAPHVNSFELGQFGRYRTNVWAYRGLNTGGVDRQEQLKLHPTTKPVGMLADAMLDCSQRGGLVLDPFGGSGSTVIAAEKTGRRARVIELDPVYVDRSIRRWQTYVRDDAVHVITGETFNDREQRLGYLREVAAVCWMPDASRPTIRRVDFSKAVQS